jgi:hypothetical protein
MTNLNISPSIGKAEFVKWIPKATLTAVRTGLQRTQTLDSFKHEMDSLLRFMPSEQLFRQAGLTFIREAWVIYYFAKAVGADRLTLWKGDRPDAAIRIGQTISEFEIVEVLENDRKRGEQKWDGSAVIVDPVEKWSQRAAEIPDAVKRAVRKKSGKAYPETVGLIIYLNIGEWGIRQTEIQASLHAATELARGRFRQVWVFWKSRFYLLWDSGAPSEYHLESDYWRDS